MWLRLDADGMNIEIRIKHYEATNADNWDSAWCCIDCNFQLDGYVNYFMRNDEALMCHEIDYLESKLDDFISGKLKKEFLIECIEPYFEFKFNPSRKITEKDSLRNVLYYSSNHNMTDPFVEWRIIIWDTCGIPTSNYISTPLFMENMIALRDYLKLITGKLDKNSEEITKLANKGMLYGQF